MKAVTSKVQESARDQSGRKKQQVSFLAVVSGEYGHGGGCYNYAPGEQGLFFVIGNGKYGNGKYGNGSGYVDLVMSREEMVALRDALTVGIDNIKVPEKQETTEIVNVPVPPPKG
jgi:hypothetical protein